MSRRVPDRAVRSFALLLAFVGVTSALLRYLVPPDLHVAITRPIFGAYATEQLAVLARHPLAEAAHRLGGALYMILGVLQFLPGLRARRPTLHRWSGRVFVALSIVVGVSGATMVALFPFEPGERAPSFLFATLLVAFTLRAVVHARRRELVLHQEWMTRAFAVGLGIGTIRLIAVTLTLTTDLPTRVIVVPSFWAGWLVTLAAAEVWIRAGRSLRSPSRLGQRPSPHDTHAPAGAASVPGA